MPLRSYVTEKHSAFVDAWNQRSETLKSDESWNQLSEEQQQSITADCDVREPQPLDLSTQDALTAELTANPVSGWDDRIDALGGRFARVRETAAKLLQPETQSVELPRRTLKTQNDVDEWLNEVQELLSTKVKEGPVVVK